MGSSCSRLADLDPRDETAIEVAVRSACLVVLGPEIWHHRPDEAEVQVELDLDKRAVRAFWRCERAASRCSDARAHWSAIGRAYDGRDRVSTERLFRRIWPLAPCFLPEDRPDLACAMRAYDRLPHLGTGTIAEAIFDGLLCGVRGDADGRAVTIVAAAICPPDGHAVSSRAPYRLCVLLDCWPADGRRYGRFGSTSVIEGLYGPVADDPRALLAGCSSSWLRASGWEVDQRSNMSLLGYLADHLATTLARPPSPRSVIAWYQERLRPHLTEPDSRGRLDGHPTAERFGSCRLGRVDHEVWLDALDDPQPDYAGAWAVKPRAMVVRSKDRRTVGKSVQLAWRFASETLHLDVDLRHEQVALAQLERARAQLTEQLCRGLDAYPALLGFVLETLFHGPPPCAYRAALGDHADRSADRLLLADPRAWPHAAGVPELQLLYSVDDWGIGLCPRSHVGPIFLGKRGHPFHLIASGDRFEEWMVSADGDEPTFRSVVTWLRNAIRRRKLDRKVRRYSDYEGRKIAQPAFEWLTFERSDRPEVPIDLRLEPHLLLCRVGESLPRSLDHDATVGTYHAFLREVIDPLFEPHPVPAPSTTQPIAAASARLTPSSPPASPPSPAFAPGQRVQHAKYGRGEVVAVTPGGAGDTKVTVRFADRTERRLLAKFLRVATEPPRTP